MVHFLTRMNSCVPMHHNINGIFAHLIRTSIAPNVGLKEKHIKIAAALFAKQQEEKLGTEPKVPVPAK